MCGSSGLAHGEIKFIMVWVDAIILGMKNNYKLTKEKQNVLVAWCLCFYARALCVLVYIVRAYNLRVQYGCTRKLNYFFNLSTVPNHTPYTT